MSISDIDVELHKMRLLKLYKLYYIITNEGDNKDPEKIAKIRVISQDIRKRMRNNVEGFINNIIKIIDSIQTDSTKIKLLEDFFMALQSNDVIEYEYFNVPQTVCDYGDKCYRKNNPAHQILSHKTYWTHPILEHIRTLKNKRRRLTGGLSLDTLNTGAKIMFPQYRLASFCFKYPKLCAFGAKIVAPQYTPLIDGASAATQLAKTQLAKTQLDETQLAKTQLAKTQLDETKTVGGIRTRTRKSRTRTRKSRTRTRKSKKSKKSKKSRSI